VTLYARVVAGAVQQSQPALPASWRFPDGHLPGALGQLDATN